MPYDFGNAPGPRLPEIGCWRAHANLWSHVVSSGISTALILEDDADFSVGIRDIMEAISTQLQEILEQGTRSPMD